MFFKTAFCRLTQFGVLRFEGADTTAFLQGQLTCNVQALEDGHSQYGGYCTPKGRLLASFLLWRDGDAYCMLLPVPLCEPIRKRLSMYILRSKVKAFDISSEQALFGLAAAGAPNVIAQLAGTVPPSLSLHRAVHNAEVTVIRLPIERYLIAASAARAAGIQGILAASAAERESAFWDRLDIAAGIPVVLPATQEQFVPQTVNLDLIGAVSFDKGCYPGQEIVARTHYLGKVKQRMALAHMDGNASPSPGEKLYSAKFGDQASGMIVSAAPAGNGGFDALAVVQSADLPGAEVRLGSPDGPALTLRPPPYPLP